MRTVVEVHYQGVWHSVRVLYTCARGIATDNVQRTYATEREPRAFTPLYNKYEAHARERSMIIAWEHVWAVRPRAACPECGGSGQEGLDGLGREPDGACAICDGSGRYIPAPWADATAGLGLGQAGEHPGPHIGFKEPH